MSTSADEKPWGDVVLASLAVQVITFSGLLLVAFSAICHNKGQLVSHLQSFLVPAFAAGALGATTVFLLIPEALLLLQAGTADVHAEEEEDHVAGNSTTTEEEGHEGHDHLLLFRRFLEEEVHTEHAEENTSYMWMFGVAVLAGFLLPVLISTFFPSVDPEECEVCAATAQEQSKLAGIDEQEIEEEEDNNSYPKSNMETVDMNCEEGVCGHSPSDHVLKNSTPAAPAHGVRNWSLVASISVGDALHNFTDGVFLGNAFLLCGRSVAYTMVATTIYHELAQEISDLGLLTNHCGLPLWLALVINFFTGSSTLIGALLVLSLDISEKATGIFLAMSAGVYVNIFACECMPRVQEQLKSPSRTLQFLVSFALGAVPIGLVLLNHGHCDEGHDH
jgi:zinc transporter ZupT